MDERYNSCWYKTRNDEEIGSRDTSSPECVINDGEAYQAVMRRRAAEEVIKQKNLSRVDMPEEVIAKLSELIFPGDCVTG